MKIQTQDLFHGPALMQIVEHSSFKALNRASTRYGHYLVNTDRHIFTKYRTNKKSPWSFTFQTDELEAIAAAMAGRNTHVFVALVCGHETICVLNQAELAVVVDLHSGTPQRITVEVPSGGSCHVRGSQGELGRVVPHNAFPNKVFA